jgi:hypothetical protein
MENRLITFENAIYNEREIKEVDKEKNTKVILIKNDNNIKEETILNNNNDEQ